MSLTATARDHIASSLDGTLPAAPPDERRRDPRMLFNGEATIIRCDGADRRPIVARVRDVSASGIGLAYATPLEKGERFIAVLPRELSHVARGVLCTVAHSPPAPDGGFHIGAKFERLLIPADDSQAGPAPGSPAPAPREPANPVPAVSATSIAPTPTPNRPASAPAPRSIGEVPRIMSHEECVHRAEQAMQARTLSGVVGQVIALAASPRSDLSDLASLIARDPMLSARILQAANSASYASTRGTVSTIPEAVRNIGCTAVRDIAAGLGVFDAMPASSRMGAALSSIGRSVPSRAINTVWLARPTTAPMRIALLTGLSSKFRVSSLTMLNTSCSGRPWASRIGQPVRRWAVGFMNVTRASKSVVITASPMLDSAIANHCRCRAASDSPSRPVRSSKASRTALGFLLSPSPSRTYRALTLIVQLVPGSSWSIA